MTTVYKVLAQSNPAANTLTTVYTVPAANSAVLSTIMIANISGTSNATYSLAVQKGGAALTSNNYIIFNSTVLANDSAALTLGITLAATDVLSANCSIANVAINVFGSEVY
jgi:alpha-L-arabinofuranosidase